uniref:guanylate cyclase n=1 Tax=Loxodonta africana TaxID=9785 RepID=G3U1X3_LOXAF
FTLGVLGPWDCDPIFAQALPNVAAQLSVDQANQDPSLLLGSRLDSVILPTGCDTPQALATFLAHKDSVAAFVGPVNPGFCPAAALLAQGWVCEAPEGGGKLVPTLPSGAQVLLSILRHFGWARMAIVSVATTFGTHGLPVRVVTSSGPGGTGGHRVGIGRMRAFAGSKVSTVVLCMHSATILLSHAWAKGLANGQLIFLPYDTLLFVLPYRNRSYPALDERGPLRQVYDMVPTITLESGPIDKAFAAARASGEVAAHLEPEEVFPLFGTIYDTVVLLAHALNCSESHGAGLSGAHLGNYTGTLDMAGFSQRIQRDEKGRRLAQYVILDTDGWGSQLVPTHILDTGTWQVLPLGRAIHYPGGAPPARDSSCWFDPNSLCMRGVYPSGSLLALALACALVLAGGALTCLIRSGIQQLQLVQGPHQILLTTQELTFIHQPPSRRRLHVDSASESRRAQGSVRSLLAPQEPASVALYQGDWVWLKKFEVSTAQELRPSSLSLLRKQMQELRHKNVATCLGFFVAHGARALVLEHCSRGSLEVLLWNEALRLDWTFKASLLLDLIRGVRYLHHRHFPHGRLKSRNSMVDGRFVLKVTDHGYAELLDAQRAPCPRPSPEELLWTAPELLWVPGGPRRGTLQGDTFSIGIILQEVLTRGPPYCSLGLSAEGTVPSSRFLAC